MGDVEFGTFNADGDLIITAEQLSLLMQDGTEDGAVEVTGILLQEGAIVLNVEATNPTLQAALDAFTGAVEDVMADPQLLTDLGGVLDTTDGGTEQALFETV